MVIRAPSAFADTFTTKDFTSKKVLKESTFNNILNNQQYTLQAKQVFITDVHDGFLHSSSSYSTYPFYYFGDSKDMCDVDSVSPPNTITLNVTVQGLVNASSGEIRVESYDNSGGSYNKGVMPLTDTATFTVTDNTLTWQAWDTIDVLTNGIENVIHVDMRTTGAATMRYAGIFIYG